MKIHTILSFIILIFFFLKNNADADFAYYLKMSPLQQVRHHIGYDYVNNKGLKVPGYSFIELISKIDGKPQRVYVVYATSNEAAAGQAAELKKFINQFPDLYNITFKCSGTAMVYEDDKEKSFYFRLGYGSNCKITFIQGAVNH